MQAQATGAAAKAAGDLHQVMPLFGQACLATVPNQTLSAGNDTYQRRSARKLASPRAPRAHSYD